MEVRICKNDFLNLFNQLEPSGTQWRRYVSRAGTSGKSPF